MRTIQAKNWSDPKLDGIRTELVQESEGVWYHVATAILVLIRSELLNPEVLPDEQTFTATSYGYDTTCFEE
jgi:hypothetical protein